MRVQLPSHSLGSKYPMRRWQNGYAAGCKLVVFGLWWFDSIPAHVDICVVVIEDGNGARDTFRILDSYSKELYVDYGDLIVKDQQSRTLLNEDLADQMLRDAGYEKVSHKWNGGGPQGWWASVKKISVSEGEREPHDPYEILEILPEKYHNWFLADYRKALHTAYPPQGYLALGRMLQKWRLRAEQYADSGYQEELEKAQHARENADRPASWRSAQEVREGLRAQGRPA